MKRICNGPQRAACNLVVALCTVVLLGCGLGPRAAHAQEAADQSRAADEPEAASAPVDASAADEAGEASEDADAIDIDEILNRPLGEDDYRERRSCVWMRLVDHIEILDDSLVLFHGRRGELWLNQLSNQCLGLRADMRVIMRSYGGNVCRLDSFRGRPRLGGIAITAECRLGTFETIDEVHAEALRRAIEERRATNLSGATRGGQSGAGR